MRALRFHREKIPAFFSLVDWHRIVELCSTAVPIPNTHRYQILEHIRRFSVIVLVNCAAVASSSSVRPVSCELRAVFFLSFFVHIVYFLRTLLSPSPSLDVTQIRGHLAAWQALLPHPLYSYQ